MRHAAPAPDTKSTTGNRPLPVPKSASRPENRPRLAIGTFRFDRSDVVKFLRAALAERARSVTELEASARAAGLLNEGRRSHRQRNSDAPRALFGSTRFGLALELVASGYGSCRRRAIGRLTQGGKRHHAVSFQAIGSKALLASDLIVRL